MLKLFQKHEHSVVYNAVRRDLVSGFAEGGLQFDSDFESANLDLVVRVTHREYNLYMRPDTNTLGHWQWYNFKVSGGRGKTIRMNIKNFGRGIRLYNNGMKPYFKKTRRGLET